MWSNNRFIYSTKILKSIAESYHNIWNEIVFDNDHIVTNLPNIVEFKVDFDFALNAIGRGEWDGVPQEFKLYRHFGKLQRIVIADILGVTDSELFKMHFLDIPRLRGYSYYLMKKYLNGVG